MCWKIQPNRIMGFGFIGYLKIRLILMCNFLTSQHDLRVHNQVFDIWLPDSWLSPVPVVNLLANGQDLPHRRTMIWKLILSIFQSCGRPGVSAWRDGRQLFEVSQSGFMTEFLDNINDWDTLCTYIFSWIDNLFYYRISSYRVDELFILPKYVHSSTTSYCPGIKKFF